MPEAEDLTTRFRRMLEPYVPLAFEVVDMPGRDALADQLTEVVREHILALTETAKAAITAMEEQLVAARGEQARLRKEIDGVAFVGTVEGRRAIWFTQEPVSLGAHPLIASSIEDVDARRQRRGER